MGSGTHDAPAASAAETAPAATPEPRGARAGRWLARGLLAAWAPAVLLVIGSLMTGHWAPLPTPSPADALLRQGLSSLPAAAPSRSPRWTLVHVLYTGCRCSRRVFDHLTARATPADLREVVLLVGPAEDEPELVAACAARGTPCVRLTQTELEHRFGIEAAPLFVVADPNGTPRYVGGYTARKQGLDYQDLTTVARLRAGETVERLPVFGCGVSDSLQDALDPFGIKY